MATSQNGWPARADLPIVPLVVEGVAFKPGIRGGVVHTVLEYVAQQVAARVEKPVDPGCWGFSFRANANDPNSLSNHSSGTAIDYNAPKHPNGVPTKNTFTQAQTDEVHKILRETLGVVRWGGDYTGTPDAMHFEINANKVAVAAVAMKIRLFNRPTRFRIVSHNIHSAGRTQLGMRIGLRMLIHRTRKPLVICIQEGKHFSRNLKGYWRREAHSKRPESGNCLIFTRHDVNVIDHGKLEIDGEPWLGVTHDVMHAPHVYPWVLIERDGNLVVVMCDHRTPGGPDAHEKTKRASFAAEDRDEEQWIAEIKEQFPGVPILIVGDKNDAGHVHTKPGVRALARRVGGILRLVHIDGVIAVGCTVAIKALRRFFRSDHRPVVIDVDLQEK